jgi:hypothetical protein
VVHFEIFRSRRHPERSRISGGARDLVRIERVLSPRKIPPAAEMRCVSG